MPLGLHINICVTRMDPGAAISSSGTPFNLPSGVHGTQDSRLTILNARGCYISDCIGNLLKELDKLMPICHVSKTTVSQFHCQGKAAEDSFGDADYTLGPCGLLNIVEAHTWFTHDIESLHVSPGPTLFICNHWLPAVESVVGNLPRTRSVTRSLDLGLPKLGKGITVSFLASPVSKPGNCEDANNYLVEHPSVWTPAS
ncbi:hypothetical protein SCLCIDRAFT_10499 [Scleroderma citrinum Foug A]|uniref:Uncharacterized protein n=1 Tax=Scleroderma citrinum Foug A TaxID=1036808 RepID=A0A0C2ZY08_9AGAM|nr:hypothetical protein SCLCIDRAFT_10499 [Scleroderma citrinum Foug A]